MKQASSLAEDPIVSFEEAETLRKLRELQDYVDNAAVALHWVNEKGIIKWANKAELEMLGYGYEEYIGHHISEFHVNPQKISDILERLSNNEILNNYESELRCKDGSVKTVQITSNVYRKDGKFIHTRCFTVDVSEQKKLFSALKESELKYRQLVQNLTTPVYTTDADGFITLYNKAAVELWGREPEIGKDKWCGSYKIFSSNGAHLPLEQCPMAVCLKEKRAVYGEEIVVVRPDGSLLNIAPFPQPILDESGKMIGAVNMLIDVTGIKRTEQALRESERKFRELAASFEKKAQERTSDLQRKNEELIKSEERYHKMVDEVEDYAIILLDKNGIIQNWNRGAEKIKGYKENEIVGKSFQQFYFAEDRQKDLPNQLLELARKKGKALHEGWRMRKDGSRFWGSTVLTALHDDQGNVIGFSKVTRDLTERKITEEKMKDYTTQLEFQNEQLEQFAYAASHDMKEPLRKIIFYNNHLYERAAASLNEKEKEYLNRSIAAAKRMNKLIDDLLEYSKASSDSQDFEPVDLNEIVDEIILYYRDTVDETGAGIHFSSLPVVQAVPFQMRQLFDNLISNALKYRHPERIPDIRITSEKIKGAGNNHLQPQKEYYKITVADNGIGFEGEYEEKIFELFQRLSATQYSGTGVGLALCKKIVQNHHGYISALGHLNEGAEFRIFLPA